MMALVISFSRRLFAYFIFNSEHFAIYFRFFFRYLIILIFMRRSIFSCVWYEDVNLERFQMEN